MCICHATSMAKNIMMLEITNKYKEYVKLIVRSLNLADVRGPDMDIIGAYFTGPNCKVNKVLLNNITHTHAFFVRTDLELVK